jgi:hypothetical protein
VALNGAPTPPVQAAEQHRYATVLTWCLRLGLCVLGFGFAGYLLGVLPAQVPPARLAELWSLPLERYRALTGTPTGWGWATLSGPGDIASLAGVAILCGCALPCLLALVPLALRNGDRSLAMLCLAQAAVLLLAASGLIVA